MQPSSKNLLWTFAALLLAGMAMTASQLPVLLNKDNPLASATEEQSDASYRLPNDTYPEYYDIKLTTNVDKGERTFQGEVIIDIVVVKDTNRIVLHARQLEIIKVSITNATENDESEELLKEYDSKREFLILTRQTSQQQFTADSRYKLAIQYSGELDSGSAGFYMRTYKDEDGNDRYLAATQFESTNARHAFPCYDEPAKLANFTITINHSSTHKTISNMPVNEQMSSDNKTVFLTTDRIPTYMVSFVVSDFEFSQGVWGGVKHRLYSRASALSQRDYPLSSGMLILKHLSEYFDLEYVLYKIDYIAIPELQVTGTETYGLILIPESRLLANGLTSHVVEKSNAVIIVAHEIVHQWFGGCVPIQWWSYLWVKEAFATLLSYKAIDKTLFDWDIWQTFHIAEYQKALKKDDIYDAKPMTFYVETPSEIKSVYGPITYGKAASVLHMWNSALSERVFKRAVHNFLNDNQYKSVTEEEFFYSFEIAAYESNYKLPASIKDMLTSWTHQAGYPLLTVTRNYTDGTFTIIQEAFYNDEAIKSNKTWYVPINYAVAANPDYRNTEASLYLLNVKKTIVAAGIAETDWLLLNKQSSGYYRINYDAKNWQLITQSLIERPSIFHYRNRAQLMEDAYEFSMSNRLDHGTVLELLTSLKQEYDYAPWSTANSILFVYARFLKGHDNYDDLKFFIAQQVGPIYRRLSVNEIPGEHNMNKRIRAFVHNWACRSGVKECLQETNKKLRDLIIDEIPIERTLQGTLYCNGVKQSSDMLFDTLYQKLMDSEDPNLRTLLINTLGCSQNENQIKKFIYSSIDASNNLTPTERSRVLKQTYAQSEIALKLCIEFLNENWIAYGNLSNKIGSSNQLDQEMRTMATYIVSKAQEERYLALLAKLKTHERVSSTVESVVLNKLSKTFEWIKEHGEPIMAWVSKYRSDAEKSSSASSSVIS